MSAYTLRTYPLLLLTLFCCGNRSLIAAPQTIASIAMDEVTAVRKEEVRAALPFAVGDPYVPSALAEALTILRTWGIFTTVEATTTATATGMAIYFHFTEAQLVGEIEIHGNYPFVENRIRRNLSLRPGDPYDRTQIDAQIDRIKTFYDREGYHNTEITATEEWQPYTQDMRVDFYIKKGTSYTPGQVTVQGNTVYPVGRFISAINPWKTYTKQRMREAIEKVTRLYHQRHYPKARIHLIEERINPHFNEIDLRLSVEEGPHVSVRYLGNDHVSDHDCTKALTIFKEGRMDEFELEASADALRGLYARRGYPEATVAFDRQIVNEGEVVITFAIHEGAYRTLHRLFFVGNTAMRSGKLQGQMLTQPISLFHHGTLDRKLLDEDREALATFYQSRGYLDVQVDHPTITPNPQESRFLDITILVNEGAQYMVGTVQFAGNIHATHETLLKPMKLQPGRPMNLKFLAEDKEAMRLYYMDHGYPYIDVQQEVTTDTNNQHVHVRYTIDEGPLVVIGQVLIIGDFLTSQKAIRNAMSVYPGDPYSEQKILASQLGIRRLGAFRSVAIETVGLRDHATTIPLKVRVEEEKPFTVDIDAGYSTDQHLTGTISFTNSNSFGWAKRTRFRLTGGERLSRGEIGWIDPRFLGHDLQWTTNTWLQYEEKPAFHYLQAGGGFGLFRQFHRTGFYVRWNLERNYFIGGDSVAADAESLRDSTISNVGLGASFDTRNNFSDPTKGVFLNGGVDFLDEIRGNQANFARLFGGVSHHIQLFRGVTFSQYGRLAGIPTFGRNVSVPSNKLFFLGGDDTIRGFAQDSLGPVDPTGRATGGRVRWIYNAEVSTPLFQGFKFATFFDMGSLTNAFADITAATTRKSIGFGLRYITPVGPLRADYGMKLDPRPGESAGRFHFTFGHIF